VKLPRWLPQHSLVHPFPVSRSVPGSF